MVRVVNTNLFTHLSPNYLLRDMAAVILRSPTTSVPVEHLGPTQECCSVRSDARHDDRYHAVTVGLVHVNFESWKLER